MPVKDRRFQFTEQLIRREFKRLIKERAVERITVAELCRCCGINRGTFYLHYKDCYELFEQLGTELANKLAECMEDIFDSDTSLRAKVSQILSILYDEDEIGYILFANDRSMCFEQLAEKAREATVSNWLKRSSLSRQQAELIYAYISGGCYMLTKQIGSGELKVAETEIHEMLFKLISEGLGAFVCGIGNHKQDSSHTLSK